MKINILYLLVPFFLCTNYLYADSPNNSIPDTLTIIKLNKQALASRFTDAISTVKQAKAALVLAQKISYHNGIGEANRVIGIGFGYQNLLDTSFNYYLKALKEFKISNNEDGQAKVNNNIGNLYRENDYDIAQNYYNDALRIALRVKDEDLLATVYMNLGNVYIRKKLFTQGLDYLNKADVIFTKLNNTLNMIQCTQNKGVVYYHLKEFDKAESLLLEANKQAKEKDLNIPIASINLTLTELYMSKKQFDKAEFFLKEGLTYAEQAQSTKLQHDYKLTLYELQFNRKDYTSALFSLREIYRLDSITFKNAVSTKLILLNKTYEQKEQEHKNELLLADKNRQQILFWSTILVAGLLLVVIFLLVSNVNRKAKTNKHLTDLNQKITEQKENLNQINHHLEEIIDERTKDLQVKNKKLADYSLHLSHQIRGPIATLKGLLNLEKDNLIEQDECIKLMNKCVSEIDDNIIDMSGMLHETSAKTV